MKKLISGFWYSLPIQLLLLHCRKYQVLLLFWYILFATIAGNFLSTYGSVALYLAPEYLGKVNWLSAAIVGMAVGIFIMSWNITTFILHSRLLHFLATTAQPFLKYCINNALLPLAFLLFYYIKAIAFLRIEEYFGWIDIAAISMGFLLGFFMAILIAFLYFFTADQGIYFSNVQEMTIANREYVKEEVILKKTMNTHHPELRVDWFLSAFLHLRKPRDTSHYSNDFLEHIFKRHHLAAVYAILVAFIFLIIVGFFSDNMLFQLPAAASITILFAILIAGSGAFVLFLHNWSIPVLLLVYSIFHFLYVKEIFDPRNKVYGLNYPEKKERPRYCTETINALATDSNVQADKQDFLKILDNWKQHQSEKMPTAYIINVSGGGSRSATFTMNVLQKIDSLMNGKLMQKTILLSGASGGMLGAAYYRELYREKIKEDKAIDLQDNQYVNDISKDLLNPLFSSFVIRDMLGPVQKFNLDGCEYVKDRGYAFEQQLNRNTNGILDRKLKDYLGDEQDGIIPTIVLNPVISKDCRKMIIATHPVRFLMQPEPGDSARNNICQPDAVDFNSFFARQNPTEIKLTTALRMNATFPYVLPNVWLPTNPIIDVVDAGIRDNYGQETSLRFIETFKDWFKKNTSNIVLIEIRDDVKDDWENPIDNTDIFGFFTKPLMLLQNNWFKIQDYSQHNELEHFLETNGGNFKMICFQYLNKKNTKPAGLSFHLTSAEKKEIASSLNDSANVAAYLQLKTVKEKYPTAIYGIH